MKSYVSARGVVGQDVAIIKVLFHSQSKVKFKIKADVLKSIWVEMPKYVLPDH